MGKKKGKLKGKKRVIVRGTQQSEEPAKKPAPEKQGEAPKITPRIKEKDAGFGVIKFVVGAVIVLILGIGLFSRIYGTDQLQRGDKGQGESCQSYDECRSGFVCLSYGDHPQECLEQCSISDASSCRPGYTCVSATFKRSRKSKKVRPVCVQDAWVK